MLARALILCTLLPLAACAAAMPGYTPPPFKESKAFKPKQSGDMDAEGAYHMSKQEKSTDCRHIKGAMMVTINRLRHRAKEVGTSSFALGANKVTTPLWGGTGKGLDRDAEYQRDRARLEAYNRHLADKSCPTVNIEAELQRPPDSPD
jgi:hypothetical protein